ncbi:MAG: metallophosphoesterase [Lachnospiraceae bacterium]|nr:metallophosphoesterase [Lachnospiraceae bacterium]
MKNVIYEQIKASMHKVLSLMLVVVLCITTARVADAATVSANVTMDKSSYVAGEEHVISYDHLSGSARWWAVYKRTDIPGIAGVTSKMWAYMNGENGTIRFSDADSSSECTWSNLPIGEYKLCLFGDESKNNNGEYTVKAECYFTIVAGNAPAAPLSVTYERSSVRKGVADGKVTITNAESNDIDTYALYWGNNEGPFEGYDPILVSANKTGTTEYEFLANMAIPDNTTKLYAFSKKGNAVSLTGASVAVDKNAVYNGSEKPYLKFTVMSDLHVQADPGFLHNVHLKKALNDIVTNAPDSDAIVCVGDITDFGQSEQYAQLKSIFKSVKGLPEVVFTAGNHEFRDDTGYDAQVKRFLDFTGYDNIYYSTEFAGCTFVVCGTETTQKGEEKWNHSCHFSEEQIAWLDKTLEEACAKDKPVFLFNHQPLYDTTSGSLEGQNWDGIRENDEVRAILDKYPTVTMFTGHTHWELEAIRQFFNGNGVSFSAFNDGSVGYLWTDEDKHKEGSTGLYVEVYGDRILVKGRNFDDGHWVTKAQFIVDYDKVLNLKKTKENVAALKSKNDSKTVAKALVAETEKLYASLTKEQKKLVVDYDKITAAAKALIGTYDKTIRVSNGAVYLGDTLLKNQKVTIGGKVYITDAAGKIIKNKVITFNKTLMALDKNGQIVKNKLVTINKKKYICDKAGKVLKGNKLVKFAKKNYIVDKNGVVAQGKWMKLKGKKYYAEKTGVLVCNKTKKIGKKKYTFNKKCVCVK